MTETSDEQRTKSARNDGEHRHDDTYESHAPEAGFKLRGSEKRRFVATMFDRIAGNYDLMNLVISLGQTTWWRLRALRGHRPEAGAKVLDVGCGTGWVAKNLHQHSKGALHIDGLDVSHEMLRKAKSEDSRTAYLRGDVTAIPSDDGHYDLITTFFTLRNFPDLQASLDELVRVLRPGGTLIILDSFPVKRGPMAFLHGIWLKGIVPILVKPFADPKAYEYLASSIENQVPSSEALRMLQAAGAASIEMKDYSFGAATCITATKE